MTDRSIQLRKSIDEFGINLNLASLERCITALYQSDDDNWMQQLTEFALQAREKIPLDAAGKESVKVEPREICFADGNRYFVARFYTIMGSEHDTEVIGITKETDATRTGDYLSYKVKLQEGDIVKLERTKKGITRDGLSFIAKE